MMRFFCAICSKTVTNKVFKENFFSVSRCKEEKETSLKNLSSRFKNYERHQYPQNLPKANMTSAAAYKRFKKMLLSSN